MPQGVGNPRYPPNGGVMEQRTDEWYNARLGLVTGSRLADVITKKRNGEYSVRRSQYMQELASERRTGARLRKYVNKYMQIGIDEEPAAISWYTVHTGEEVIHAGFVRHNSLSESGASPDGLVGDNGVIEVKCPTFENHVVQILMDEIPGMYLPQIGWELACTEREWCDYISFNRGYEGGEIFIKRLYRDDKYIKRLEHEVAIFLDELHELLYVECGSMNS